MSVSKYTPPATVFAAGHANVGSLFHAAAAARPEHTAIVDGERTLTYSQLEARSNQLANAFVALELERHDRVAILASNCAEYFEVELAAAKAGVIVAALNWRLGDRELRHCIELVSPRLLITTETLSENLDRLNVGSVQRVVIGAEYEAMLANATSDYPDLTVDSEDGLVILYTSGTTGLPKGALISHRAMIARGMLFASEFGVPRDDHFLAWAPMFHMASTDQGLTYLLRGGTVHMLDGYQPAGMLDAIERYPMHWLLLIPGMIAPFIAEYKARPVTPKGLGCIGAMADLVPREEIREVTTLLNAPFSNTFGATETGLGPATGGVIGIGEAPNRLPKQQSAFCDVRLVDSDDNEVAVGEPGEVSMTGPTLFSGYWNNDAVNESDFRGGRFHMGDVLRRNADGSLEYVDRVKYMIKSGGENIYPAEIEQVVEADERIETAVVVRKADDRWGEVPVLFVVRRSPALNAADVGAICDEALSRYKRPKAIHFVTDEELPRSTTGKIQRHILEARL